MISVHEGCGATIESALAAAEQGISSPRLIIFLLNGHELAYVAEHLHCKYPDITTMGICSSIYANGHVDHASVLLLAFDDDTAACSGIIHGLSRCPVQSIQQFEQDVLQIDPGKENTLCLEFCTGSEETLVTTLNAVLEEYDIPLIGTTVYGDVYHSGYVVAWNGQLWKDSCIYAIIRNRRGRIKLFNENIYGPRPGAPMHIATQVDRQKKALVELDGQPAAEVYSKELGIPIEDTVANVMMHPLGRIVGNHVFTFSMRDQLPDGTLYNFKQINRNDAICLLELKDYKKIFRETIARIKAEVPQIAFVFSIDCVYRYMLYETLGCRKDYARLMNSLGGPHVGATGAGEQINNQHVNQNMVCAVFEDATPKG